MMGFAAEEEKVIKKLMHNLLEFDKILKLNQWNDDKTL